MSAPLRDVSPIQTSGAAATGTVQIMVGLFNIGLGPGRTSTSPGDLAGVGAAYWLGAVFTVTGIFSILGGRLPSACLLGFTVFMNIVGAIFAITGIVLYALDLAGASLLWLCEQSLQPGAGCKRVALIAQNLLRAMDVVLIGLIVLLLFASVRFAVLGIRALSGGVKEE